MSPITPPREPVDLDNCAREPIHIPGAIQPHGALLVCDEETLALAQCSSSVEQHLGLAPAALLGRPLGEIFDAASAQAIADARREPLLRAVNPLRLSTRDGRAFEAVLHRPPGDGKLLALELEPLADGAPSGSFMFDPRLRAAILRLQSASDPAAVSNIAAEEVRALTGFDRVMVYRFDAEWNGEVVAEARRDDLDSFLHQHYPASDIPAQARKLYELNWLRLIADARYVPSPMVALDPHAAPLDMSLAGLRSVSPIHLEYLANMGVRASMSISLVRDGTLAGLIACHHYDGPRRVPFATRETCEYLGQALSWHGKVLESAQLATRQRAVQQLEAALVGSMSTASDLLDGLANPALVELAGASGASIVLSEGSRNLGVTPTPEQVKAIVEMLKAKDSEVFATEKLSEHLRAAEGWEESAAGLLAVAISRELGEYLLWFRPSSERVIDWAGNPHHVKLTSREGEAPRLSPRGSFALWREEVRGRSLPWESWEIEGASSLRRLLLGGIRRRAVELRTLNQRLVEADRAKDNFIATVSHELRTPLNAISGWAGLLRAGNLPSTRMPHAFDVIARNAETQLKLIEDLLDVSRITSGKLTLNVEPVDLLEVVQGVVESSALAAEARGIRLTSVLDPSATPILGDPFRLRQVLANLLNNAVKFTNKGGWVRVSLRRFHSEVELLVEDSGKGITADFLPHVFEAFRQEDAGMNRRSQGLGLGLAIVRKLVELHGGRVWAASDGEGMGASFFVRLPISSVMREPEQRPLPEPGKPEGSAELAGLRILVVEDEPDASDFLRQVLLDCGAQVTCAPDALSALALLEQADSFDVIVSDIGMPGLDGLQMIRLLRAHPAEEGGRIPAVALTAYTRGVDRTRALQAGFQSHVPKPVDPHELVAVVASLVRR